MKVSKRSPTIKPTTTNTSSNTSNNPSPDDDQSATIVEEKTDEEGVAKPAEIDHIQIEKQQAISAAKHSLQKLAAISSSTKFSKKVTKRSEAASNNLNSIDEALNEKALTSKSLDKTESTLSYYLNVFCIRFNYFVVSPDELCMYCWLIVLSTCVLYNLWIIIRE